jgi:hypothetical protein
LKVCYLRTCPAFYLRLIDDSLELGVNFSHIKIKTMSVLNPFKRIDSHIMDDRFVD